MSDSYPEAICAIINDRVVAESEDCEVEDGGRASTALFNSFLSAGWFKSMTMGGFDKLIIDLELCTGVVERRNLPTKWTLGRVRCSRHQAMSSLTCFTIISRSNLCQPCPSVLSSWVCD